MYKMLHKMEPQGIVPSPFEKNAVLKAYKCSSCNRIYSTQVHANTIGGRLPLLMPCSHTVCEECLMRMAKTKNICCKVCQYEMLMEHAEAFSDFFPVDRFMFGSLMNLNLEVLKKNSPRFEKRMSVVPFLPAGSSFKTSMKKSRWSTSISQIDSSSEKDADTCSQGGCSKRAEFRCNSCRELYCTKCDKRVHESIRILRDHRRYPIDIADFADFTVSCKAHAEIVGEYSCITCGCMLCTKCVMKDHYGHAIISVEDKNEQELESFKETLRKGKSVLKSMEYTQKKVRQELASTQRPASTLESDIIRHFATLHSRLQLLEQSMLDQLSKAQSARTDSLYRLSSELSSNISTMSSLVSTGNMVVEGGREHMEKLLLSELKRSITENLVLPCELVEEGNKKVENVRFIVDDLFIDTLQNHCRIDFEEGSPIKLAPLTDFSEKNFEAFSDETSMYSSDAESIRSTCESESSTTSPISYVKPGCKTRLCLTKSNPTQVVGEVSYREKVKTANEPIVFVKGTMDNIIVTHLTNPSHFYIQLVRKRKEIEELTNKYEVYAEHAATAKSPEIGSTYIVQFITDKVKKWYRGTVRDIHAAGITTLYEVFFIDYGNTTVVPASKIKMIKPVFMQQPPFAYRCRLAGIISQKNEWPDTVLMYMLKFISPATDPPLDPVGLQHFLIYENRNTHLKMLVKENQKGILDIDLIAHNESLSAALIFMGYASTMDNKFETRRLTNLTTVTKIAATIVNYHKDRIYPIQVTNIISPYCIYVQLLENIKIISNMETAMTRHYQKNKKQMVFIPEKGMVCVAQLEASKDKWWRVEIKSLPGDQNVEVFALDYGFTEIISWTQLCKINDVHKQTDAQAVQVSLSDIAPPKYTDNVWPEDTTDFLKEYLKDKNLSMYVNQTSKEKLMVTLYEHTNETDICIDALLVRKELAESTGESSLLVEFHKVLPGENTSKPSKSNTIATQLSSNIKAPKPEKNNLLLMDSKSYAAGVKIIKINSPNSFYVDVPDWYDEKMKMVKQMALYYSDKIPPCKKWEIDNKCVILSSDDKYYRAIVTKVLEDDTYEVFLKDFVLKEVVPTRQMFELNDIFATHDYSLHCRLGGMKPAGGSDKWSAKALELFQEFVDQYDRLYVSKYGPPQDKVLSVQLFTQWEESSGPLEPTKVQRLVLNDTLLESGVAFPVKVECFGLRSTSPNESVVTVSKSKNKIVEDNCFESDLAPFSRLLEEENALSIGKVLSSTNSAKPTKWLPPVKLNDKHFKAVASYVDFEGGIYFQTSKARRLLKNVNRILETHFKSSIPDPLHQWEVGQMCTVLYHLDDSYYRGTIVDITGEKIIVKFIDFGNQEEVSHNELRSEVIATDIPTLCIKCRLSNVVPKTGDGSWSVRVLDRLHVTLVDKECELVIDETLCDYVDDPYVLIYLDGECINNLINSTEWSDPETTKKTRASQKPSDDEDVVIEDEIFTNADIEIENEEEIIEDVCEVNNGYKYVQLPRDKNSFKVIVINIIDYRTIIVEADFAVGIINSTKDQFNQMSLEIASEGANQPEISLPIIGTPCIALFGQDNLWYRAEILDIMDSRAQEIKVLFIDFGNVEIMPVCDIRVIKQHWLDFPVSMLRFKIWGILNNPDYDTLDVTAAMKEVIVDKQMICQIQNRKPEVEVKLIDEETYEVLYKLLLDEKIIQSID